ncbi:MAG: LarC family nickel insertion protein [Thermoplasmatota archaeon]
MTIAYFDCFSGIAGDMILGAFIDLGMDFNFFKKEIKKLNIDGYEIKIKKIKKNSYDATDVQIYVKQNQPYRTFNDIMKIIDGSTLTEEVKQLSKKIFYNLAKAESIVHKVDLEDVHFHEVGAIDSIIDIVGFAIGINHFKVTKVYCSSLPLGTGFVICQHGKMPVPAPATKQLLKSIPTYNLDSGHEMVTPTGAAVIKTIAEGFGEMPSMKIKNVGYGAGKIQSSQPGVLRVYLGEM